MEFPGPFDVLSDVDGSYGLIVSNPPFDAGVATDSRVVESFFCDAGTRLCPGGSLRVVANRFLRYRQQMEA